MDPRIWSTSGTRLSRSPVPWASPWKARAAVFDSITRYTLPEHTAGAWLCHYQGRHPGTLSMNQTCSCATPFWLPGIINLVFLKYVQGLEGVGTQCVEAVSTWKHFWGPSKAACCRVVATPFLTATSGSACYTLLPLPSRAPVTLLHVPLALQTPFNRHMLRSWAKVRVTVLC